MLGKKKTVKKTYDPATQTPMIHCSICNGEMVAGFKNKKTGDFEEVTLIRDNSDLELFKLEYGIKGDIEKEY